MQDRRSGSAHAGAAAAAPQALAFEPGTVLQGTYRIVAPLASGGMGELYIAAHERLPGRYAVKVLHRECLNDEEAMSRFRCEAEIMSGLRHPNIVQVFDFNVTDDGVPYLVMELLEGKDLSEILGEGRTLPPRRVGTMVHQIASALGAAHARGVVHRDLKPENVMLLELDGQEDFVKVVDFGISKARWSHRITADCTILGTPQFMSPEQAQGRRDLVDARTDQFALAAMAYTLLTGREPFRGETAVTVLYQVVHQEPEPIGQLVSWPCDKVDAVIGRAMSKDREDRYPSVMEFARALDEALRQDLMAERTPAVTLASRRGPVIATSAAEIARLDTLVAGAATPTTVKVAGRRRLRGGMMLGGMSAVAVVTLALYLPQLNVGPMGEVFGVAYRQAVAATKRTVERWTQTPAPRPAIADELDLAATPESAPEPLPAIVGAPMDPVAEPAMNVPATP